MGRRPDRLDPQSRPSTLPPPSSDQTPGGLSASPLDTNNRIFFYQHSSMGLYSFSLVWLPVVCWEAY
ncbi:hypothetical protein ACHAXN_007006 [Cyclotella atomus]